MNNNILKNKFIDSFIYYTNLKFIKYIFLIIMVFYFTSSTGKTLFCVLIFKGYMIYMGKDKFENEELLKYGWPEDIWFHVDNYSSAHVNNISSKYL